jgi:hypothetical protein
MPDIHPKIMDLMARHIRIVGEDGDVIYDGPVAKTLVYDGVTYEGYILFAEPIIHNGKEYHLFNIGKNQWQNDHDDGAGYRKFIVGRKKMRRGAAMLYTFIGPRPHPSWTCHHLKTDDNVDERSDDRLDCIQWASPSVRQQGRSTPAIHAKSIPVIATYVPTGQTERFPSLSGLASRLRCKSDAITRAIKTGRSVGEWNIKYDTLQVFEGERWAKLDSRRHISSFGRLAYTTETGELIERESSNQSAYRCIRYQGRPYLIHRLVIYLFGTDQQREMLSDGHHEVDHINGETHTNCLTNLQVPTRSEHARKSSGNQYVG